MPVRAIRYGPTQYALRYRPLGFGSAPPEAPPPVPPPPGARPRRWRAWLLAAMLVTLGAHGAIALAYLGDDATPTAASAPGDVEPGEACDPNDSGTADDPLLDEGGATGSGDTGGGVPQPTDAERATL